MFHIWQECVKLEDKLSTREQALLQKVGEMQTVMDSEKNQGAVVRAILQAKQSGKINGIYGRLGDLGAIDGKRISPGVLPLR
jgi:structural maintenance of chromosome 4